MDKKELDYRQIEDQLFSTQKIENLGILSGRIAHDLNNLLTVILGNIEILKYLPAMAGNPPLELAYISEAAIKAADLTHRMLRLSVKPASPAAFADLNVIIDEYLPVLHLAVPKSIPISTELHLDLPEIRTNRSEIEQILLNLVINAGEALQDMPGKVVISTGKKNMKAVDLSAGILEETPGEGQFIFVTVADNGSGIDSSVRDRVFHDFFTTKPGGRGLGLPVVKGLVLRHHGALFMESEPGKGTRITVMFPMVQPENKESRWTLPTDKQNDEKRLFGTFIVADDEPIVLRILVKVLQSTGLNIYSAKNGLEVIKLYNEHGKNVDGLVLDVTMPGKSGMECFHELKKINPGIKVILASGAGEVKNIKAMLDDGVFSYVPKPYTLEDLEREILKILALK